MLDPFKRLIDSLQAFDFGVEMGKAIDDNKDALPDMITQQLASGRDGNDEATTLDGNANYSPATIYQKQKFGKGLGSVTDRITLFDTGELYRSLQTTVGDGVFETKSDVPYFDEVTARTGEQVTYPDEESRIEFAEKFTLPGVAAALKQKTGLVING